MPSDATPPDTPEVPGLKLLKLVGKGASGEVWTCRNETDTSFSAVKIVRRGTRPEKVWYRHELKALRKYARIRRKPDSLLDIKHVAVSEDKTFLYYTTPVADGIKGLDPSSTRYQPLTLKTLLAGRNPITPVSAAEIAARIAEALQTLHEHGLLHRDVKPDNIIFCEGRAVLADIGLVTETEQEVSLAGTPQYMEPGRAPSVRTDLYALGIVLYEMATGKAPEYFPDVPSLQDNGDTNFQLLNNICLKACGDESERYVNASQMLADLRRLAAADRPQGEAQPKPGAGPAIFSRKPALIAAAVMALAVIGLVLALALTHGDGSAKGAARTAETAPQMEQASKDRVRTRIEAALIVKLESAEFVNPGTAVKAVVSARTVDSGLKQVRVKLTIRDKSGGFGTTITDFRFAKDSLFSGSLNWRSLNIPWTPQKDAAGNDAGTGKKPSPSYASEAGGFELTCIPIACLFSDGGSWVLPEVRKR